MSSVFFISLLTAQSAHRPDSIQFQPKASSVPSPPWPIWLSSLLIGQSPLQQAQPGGLSLRLCVAPFGELSRFDPRGEGGLLLWLAVQQVLQVVQGQKVVVAFQKLLHKLQEGEKKRRLNLIVRECTRENNSISDTFHYSPYSSLLSLPSFWTILLYPLCTLNPLQSFLSFLSFPLPFSSLPASLCTCTASGDGCRARASVISRGVRRSRVAQSSTGHSMAAEMTDRKNWSRWTENALAANTQIQITL